MTIPITPRVHNVYRRILQALRSRGDRPGLGELQVAADLAVALEADDLDQVALLAARLDLTPEDLDDVA